MNNQTLSRGTAVILSAYLPYVWHDNLPVTGDRRVWEAAASLWQLVRPALEQDGRAAATRAHPLEAGRGLHGIAAVNAAVENPNRDSLVQLAAVLADLFEASPSLAGQVELGLTSGPFAELIGDLGQGDSGDDLLPRLEMLQQQVNAMRGRPASGAARPSGATPACQVCGRKDASVRVVSYPFVVSVLIVTFRRSFAGIWCSTHATLWRAVATVITISIGWLGIPFGLLFTPVALFTLARGGNQPADINRQMLMDLAYHLLHGENNPREAIRCLETALRFGATPELEARLRDLYAQHSNTSQPAAAPRLIAFPLALAGTGLVGLAAGMLEYIATLPFSLLGDSVPFVVGMLSWVPLIVALFLSGVAASSLVEGALARTRTHQKILGNGLAAIAALLSAYAVASGIVLASTISRLASSSVSHPALSSAIDLGWSVVWGGVAVVGSSLSNLTTSSVIMVSALLGMAVLNLISAISVADKITGMQRWVSDLRAGASTDAWMGAAAGWLAIAGSVFTCAVLFAGMTLVSQFQYGSPAAALHVTKSFDLLEKGDVVAARNEVEAAQATDPDSFVTYAGLAAIELTWEHCQEALDAAESAEKVSPEQGIATVYAIKSRALGCMHRSDEAIAALEQSTRLDPSTQPFMTSLGMAYYGTGQFDKAADTLARARDIDPTDASSHVGLALTYYMQDRPEDEAAELKEALAQTLDEQNELKALAGYYYEKHDLAQSEKYMRQALALTPDNPVEIAALAGVVSEKGDVEEVTRLTDRILAGPIQHVEAYLALSNVYVENERLNDALKALEQAEALDPDNPEVHAEKAWVYLHQDEYQAAAEEAGRAIEREKYNGQAYRALAVALLALDRQEEAKAAAEQSLKLQPRRDMPYYVLGVYYLNKQAKGTAIKNLKTFLALTWDHAYMEEYQTRARAYLDRLQKP